MYGLMFAIGFNLVLGLFLGAALLFRRFGKIIFSVGVVFQALAIAGTLAGGVDFQSILGIALSVIVIVGGYVLLGRKRS